MNVLLCSTGTNMLFKACARFQLRLVLSIAMLAVLAEARAQQTPDYQVIFDDFDYASTGYPDRLGPTNLFGPNYWIDRRGVPTYWGEAWYYYNWRWQKLGKRTHPGARIALDRTPPYSVSLISGQGYFRSASADDAPLQIESGFTYSSGTWAVNVQLTDLENIRYFTEAFWLISPMATSPRFSDVVEWVEFNHEWQNWFAVNMGSADAERINDISDDSWSPGNEWVKRHGYSGTVYDSLAPPASRQRTYMANGFRVYGVDSKSFLSNETAGGVPLKNPRDQNASAFSCYTSARDLIQHIEDPTTCMRFLLEDLNEEDNPWVQLLIQYDGQSLTYSAYVPTENEGFVHMASKAPLTGRLLPLRVNIGIHTPNQSIIMEDDESTRMNVDWFYYSPNATLEPWDIEDDVQYFRSRAWKRVNLDAVPLEAPNSRPWRIDNLFPPDSLDDNWVVYPGLRETNGLEIQWTYRTRAEGEAYFSNWTPWQSDGFRFNIDPAPYEAEVDVRAIDFHSTDFGEQPRWTHTACTQFNYATKTAAPCIGAGPDNTRFSRDHLPREPALHSIYPNPARSQVTITFGVPREAHVKLEIVDLLGRRIETVIDRRFTSGFHTATWQSDSLPAGTYYVYLSNGDEVAATPLIILN